MGTIRKAFAFNLRMARGTRTQSTMAETLEMPLRTYQRLEGAERFPQEATLEQITAKLGVSEESLFRIPADNELPVVAELLVILPALNEAQLNNLLSTAKLFREVNAISLGKADGLTKDNG